jgi:hypothetical protein
LQDGLAEAVVSGDVAEPGKFTALDSCQQGFLWAQGL